MRTVQSRNYLTGTQLLIQVIHSCVTFVPYLGSGHPMFVLLREKERREREREVDRERERGERESKESERHAVEKRDKMSGKSQDEER